MRILTVMSGILVWPDLQSINHRAVYGTILVISTVVVSPIDPLVIVPTTYTIYITTNQTFTPKKDSETGMSKQ